MNQYSLEEIGGQNSYSNTFFPTHISAPIHGGTKSEKGQGEKRQTVVRMLRAPTPHLHVEAIFNTTSRKMQQRGKTCPALKLAKTLGTLQPLHFRVTSKTGPIIRSNIQKLHGAQ